MRHVAFTYRDPGDLFAAYGQLRRDGVKPVQILREAERISILYRDDTDGTSVELQFDSKIMALAA